MTGLPKAAVVTHSKMWVFSLAVSSAGLNSNDVIYSCLPLYHTMGLAGVISAADMGTHTPGCIFDKLRGTGFDRISETVEEQLYSIFFLL